MASTTTLTAGLPAAYREELMRYAREVSFPAGVRLFEEGRRADRFWIIRTGAVALDLQVPGHRAALIESLGHGELIGWSWHCPPGMWHLGAETTSPVRAWEFDAEAVRALCAEDSGFGRAIAVWVGRVVAQRLHATRVRLLLLLVLSAAQPGHQPSGGARVEQRLAAGHRAYGGHQVGAADLLQHVSGRAGHDRVQQDLRKVLCSPGGLDVAE